MIDRMLPLLLALRRRYRTRHLALEFRVACANWAAGAAITVSLALLLYVVKEGHKLRLRSMKG